MFKRPGMTVVTFLVAATAAAAHPACLPKSVFAKNGNQEFPVIDLGYVDNVLTLCASERALNPNVDKLLGCWTVDPATAALGASAAKRIPGRGRRTALDAKNCIDGYCIAPISPSPDVVRTFFATSTDGAHAAIMTQDLLYVFATGTKAKVAEIELIKPDGPAEANLGNEPWGLLYNGDTLFVIGADAGPFVGLWVFKEDGSRAGRVSADASPDSDALNIYNGGYGILGRDTVAFGDAGLQNMTTVTGANGAKRSTRRNTSYAPCTKEQFAQWTEGGSTQTGACRRALDARYVPYVDMSPVQLPSGDIITSLSGPAQGYMAVLNPAGLIERRRLKLARCP